MSESHRDRSIDYVEFTVAQVARSKDFYGKAFGWSFTDFGPDYCEFASGTLRGGFNATEPVPTGGVSGGVSGGPLVILYAADLDATRASVLAAGGTIVKEPYAFPGGRRFHFADADGYELAVWSEH